MATPQIPNLDDDAIFDVNEKSVGDEVWFDWTDKAGNPIPLAALSSVTLTLYDAETGIDNLAAKIRNAQALITAGAIVLAGVTYTEPYVNEDGETVGRLSIPLTAADTTVLHPALDSELHGLLVEVVHTGGTFPDQAAIRVKNLRFRS